MADIEDSEARQRVRFRGPRVAWPTSRSASCVADVRPVQAEPAERKHKRRRCRSQGGASRTSSACAPTTRHPRRRKTDGQRPCSQRAHSKRACTQGQPGHRVPAAMKLYCFGWGRPATTDLRSNRTINCTSSVEVDTAHKEAHVAAKAAYARS